MNTKICKQCNTCQNISEFRLNKNKYRDNYCLRCRKEYNKTCEPKYKNTRKLYRINNREKLKDAYRAWYKNNRDRKIRNCRIYQQINKEKRDKYIKEWRKKNKQRISELNKLWYQNNKERVRLRVVKNLNKIKERYKFRYKTDKFYKLRVLLRNRLNNAIKFNRKAGSAVKDLQCTIDELKEYLEIFFYDHPETKEKMTWENYGSGWHIDHIKPLSSFNLENRDEFLKAFCFINLQPLWAEHNLSKNDKLNWNSGTNVSNKLTTPTLQLNAT